MKTQFLPIFLTIVVTSVLSCRKAEVDSDTQASQDNAIAESAFSRTLSTASAFGVQEEGIGKTNDFSCGDWVLVDGDTADFPTNGPVTFELDFGDGCTDVNDGRVREGKIVVTFSDARWGDKNAKIEIDLADYVEDGVSYEGTLTAIDNGDYSYTTSVDNGKCIASDWTVSYEGEKTMVWKEGYNTPDDSNDDVFEFEGSSTGIDRMGRKFTTKVTKPIDKHSACKWIRSGTVEVTPEGRATRTIDFGDGDCDDKATITINGNIIAFTMK